MTKQIRLACATILLAGLGAPVLAQPVTQPPPPPQDVKFEKVIVIKGAEAQTPGVQVHPIEVPRIQNVGTGNVMFTGFVHPGRKEKGAYLGFTGSPVPPVLCEQLSLQRGMGLVVDFVDAESPAQETGLKQYDIVQKLNDQLLVNAHQLSVLVRTFKPGDEITLTILRAGKPMALKAKLVEKELMVSDDPNPWGLPTTLVPSITSTSEIFPAPLFNGGFGELKFELVNGDAKLAWSDKDYSLMLSGDKDKHLIAKDKDGKVIFDGPITTDEQRKGLSKEIRERLEQLEQSGGRARAIQIFSGPTTQPDGHTRALHQILTGSSTQPVNASPQIKIRMNTDQQKQSDSPGEQNR